MVGERGFTEPLMYKGVPVIDKDYVPTEQVWYVTKRNRIVAKVTRGKSLGVFMRWYIYLKTMILEWGGK